MTAGQVILMAMKSLGIVPSGEDATTEEYADGLLYLQMMLRAWALERLIVFTSTKESLVLTAGTSSYTWGVGGALNSERPNKVLSADLTDSDNKTSLVDVVSEKNFESIVDKTIQQRPNTVHVQMTYPLATIKTYPVPDAAYTLNMYSVKPFTEASSFSSVSDTLLLPSGYQEPVVNNLAVRLSPVFGKAVPQVVAILAADGYKKITKNNATHMGNTVSLGIPAGNGSSYNINTDSSR